MGINKSTFDKYAVAELANLTEILNEAKRSEVIKMVLDNFNSYMVLAGITQRNRSVILENLASHLILFERLTRREERDKALINKEARVAMQKNVNLEDFKNSLRLASDKFAKTKEEKKVINRIIKRIKINKYENRTI